MKRRQRKPNKIEKGNQKRRGGLEEVRKYGIRERRVNKEVQQQKTKEDKIRKKAVGRVGVRKDSNKVKRQPMTAGH